MTEIIKVGKNMKPELLCFLFVIKLNNLDALHLKPTTQILALFFMNSILIGCICVIQLRGQYSYKHADF